MPAFGEGRRLFEDVDDGRAVLHLERHEHPRHQREVEVHVALVAVAEVLRGVLGPLVRLGEEHAAGEVRVHVAAQPTKERVGLGEVLAVRAVPLVQVRDGVEAESVDAHAEPEVDDLRDGRLHLGVVVVEVGLVAEEAVPVVLAGHRVPRPVGRLGVGEDDASVGPAGVVVGPRVEVAPPRAGRGTAGALEPRVLVGGVVHDQLGDDPDATIVSSFQELLELREGAVVGVDRHVVGDVVAVVATG